MLNVTIITLKAHFKFFVKVFKHPSNNVTCYAVQYSSVMFHLLHCKFKEMQFQKLPQVIIWQYEISRVGMCPGKA
jgi:hypothetical protein